MLLIKVKILELGNNCLWWDSKAGEPRARILYNRLVPSGILWSGDQTNRLPIAVPIIDAIGILPLLRCLSSLLIISLVQPYPTPLLPSATLSSHPLILQGYGNPLRSIDSLESRTLSILCTRKKCKRSMWLVL